MPSNKTNTDTPANATAWIPGRKPQWNAVSFHVHKGRAFIGLKGYDIKSKGHGYIRVELSTAGLESLGDEVAVALMEALSQSSLSSFDGESAEASS